MRPLPNWAGRQTPSLARTRASQRRHHAAPILPSFDRALALTHTCELTSAQAIASTSTRQARRSLPLGSARPPKSTPSPALRWRALTSQVPPPCCVRPSRRTIRRRLPPSSFASPRATSSRASLPRRPAHSSVRAYRSLQPRAAPPSLCRPRRPPRPPCRHRHPLTVAALVATTRPTAIATTAALGPSTPLAPLSECLS